MFTKVSLLPSYLLLIDRFVTIAWMSGCIP
jgi:hypothetical protein